MLFQHGVGSAPDDHVGHAKQACNQPPAGADHVYQAAIAVLISRTRGRRREYPLIFTENCNYGSTFRRNMLGLRPWGKLLAAVGILALAAIAARLTDRSACHSPWPASSLPSRPPPL